MERIITIEVEGQANSGLAKLGFDTGLTAQAFAQVKLARFINRIGVIVYPDGKTSQWKPEGVIEHQAAGASEKTLVIYGPGFPGDRLDRLIEKADEGALEALRYWVRARAVLNGTAADSRESFPCPWPAAAILAAAPGAFPLGTILFPPDILPRRAVEVEGNGAWLKGAERWTHPDLAGEDADVFAAAAMFYHITCKEPPYPAEDLEKLHSDIREGVYTPPSLIVPGLDIGIATLISKALAPVSAAAKRPSLEEFCGQIGLPHSGGPEGFARPVSEPERARIKAERDQFDRKKTARVNTRRFIRRNTTVIGGVIIAVTVLALVIGSIVRGRNALPTTNGMSPQEVIAAYYGSFGTLDHTLMEACVVGNAGKGDINTVTNIFVISKVREAYERKRPVIAAREWLDAGAAPTELTVTGVTDLRIEGEDEDERDGEVRYRTAYTLWLPASYTPEDGSEDNPEMPPETAPALPTKTAITDEVRLVLHKGAWRIAEIERKLNID
ncbi:MAG: hypothetical protein LBE17_12010 [Treponema sp.]|jgi:hypothetical protein|nr:hypothetical protein [Treponema sp.]